jgi:hypothetical protein
MFTCSNCKALLPNEAKFCPACDKLVTMVASASQEVARRQWRSRHPLPMQKPCSGTSLALDRFSNGEQAQCAAANEHPDFETNVPCSCNVEVACGNHHEFSHRQSSPRAARAAGGIEVSFRCSLFQLNCGFARFYKPSLLTKANRRTNSAEIKNGSVFVR